MRGLPRNHQSQSDYRHLHETRNIFGGYPPHSAKARYQCRRRNRRFESKAVKSVIEKFCDKYGAADVKKYYSKFDVAVVVELA